MTGTNTLGTSTSEFGPQTTPTTLYDPTVGTGIVGDRIYADLNGNGADNSEPGIAGVSVTLTWFGLDGIPGNADDTVYMTLTDAAGNYLFSLLPVGDFVMTVGALDSRYVAKAELDGTFDKDVSFSLVAAESKLDVDFGFTATMSVGDRVWLDVNANGMYNAGVDPPVTGIIVSLVNLGGTEVATATTDANGRYRFDGVVADTYLVVIRQSEFTGARSAWSAAPGASAGVSLNDENVDHNAWPNGIDGVAATVVVGWTPNTLGVPVPTGNAEDGWYNSTIDFALTCHLFFRPGRSSSSASRTI